MRVWSTILPPYNAEENEATMEGAEPRDAQRPTLMIWLNLLGPATSEAKFSLDFKVN